jgi:hypothetical protein
MSLPPYLPAPAIGSLVTVPTDAKFCYCCARYRGWVGVVIGVQRDIRSGRVLSVSCQWYDDMWRRVANDLVGIGHVASWVPTSQR